MGSYENIVKIEEMRRRMEEGDTASAQKVLDIMEIKKIKNMSDLSLIAEVYAVNERYEEAIQLYLKIYEKTKSRKSLFQLVDLFIKQQKPADAQSYLREYEKLAPKDFYKYIFRYKIARQKGEPYETLIELLETLKTTEYMEQWAYELAKTYYKAGMEKECIQECSDIILWFGEGAYVEKAKLLRSYFSGETDKEKIMEELKRRAMVETGSNIEPEKSEEVEESTSIEEEQETSELAPLEEQETTELDPLDEQETSELDPLEEQETLEPDPLEEIYSTVDFTIEKETEDFEDGLKKDIQSILVEEADQESQEEEYEDDDTPFPRQYDTIDRDIAEQEVEKAIYELLDEEDMDEDDKKLKQMAEDLQVDLEEIFGNFLHVKSIKKQLVKGLEGILDSHTMTVQLLITGADGSGKTTFAKDITMFLNKTGRLKSSKIAKIKAGKLNSIDIMSKRDTLKDCCLVVENASDLKRETIDSLLELCRVMKGNIAVIFEENKKNINKLFRECPKLMDLFKNRIHLPGYTQEDLMGFAYACLRQQDYQLNSKAEPILRHKINQITKQSESHMHLEQIYQMMQAAMNAADIRTGKQLSKLALQGRLRDVEVLTILSEDLVIKP
ncbi:MAG: hypothetical protein K0R46_442 [Herbinix sp.]|jgi:adenylate kinase family enzyme|nr:hypothetical protein [Herbinix sp.]